jgi:hypothetical protein
MLLNYRKGLFRLWMIGTAGWWVYCFTISQWGCRFFAMTYQKYELCEYRTDLGAFVVALWWPFVVFVVGWIGLGLLGWVIRGFRSR